MGKTYKDKKSKYDKFDHKKKIQYGKNKKPKNGYDESSERSYLKWKENKGKEPIDERQT